MVGAELHIDRERKGKADDMNQNERTQFPFTASELGAALDGTFRVDGRGEQWQVKDQDGCAVAWVRLDPPAIEAVLNVFWTEGSEDDEDALEERKEAAMQAIDTEFRELWEQNGFEVPEHGELSQHEVEGVKHDYYRVWVTKPVRCLEEAVEAIRWVTEQERTRHP